MICPSNKAILVGVALLLLIFGQESRVLAGQIFTVTPKRPNALAYAVRKARPGDTIILQGGTYRVGEVLMDRRKGMGGAPGQYITIKAASGEEPILRGRRRFIIQADYVRVEGLHFVMPWRLEAFGRGLQIVHNKFTGPQPKYGAIEVGGQDILLEGNFIHYKDVGGNTRDHGIYVHRGERITLRNNTVIGTKGYGIHVFDEHKSANPRDWKAHPFKIKEYILEGNFVSGSQTRSGIIIAKGRGGKFISLENITIRNNVMVGNAEFGLLIREGKNISVYNNTFYKNHIAALFIREPSKGLKPVSDVDIKNNIFFGRAHVGNMSPGQNIVLDNNLYNAGPRLRKITDSQAIVGDPKFIDAEASNFHLQKSSVAIDAGIEIGLPFTGAAPDLGAFEFGDPSASGRAPGNGAEEIAPRMAYASPPPGNRQQPNPERKKRIQRLPNPTPGTDGQSNVVESAPKSEIDNPTTKAILVSFRAYVVGSSIILNWKCGSDVSQNGFEVERSQDNKNFRRIGFVQTQAAQNYQYLDEGLQWGTYYYRLRVLQEDGSFKYSTVIVIQKN